MLQRVQRLFRPGECHRAKHLLSAYVDGEVSTSERQALERHLDRCSSCRQELDSLRATVALLHRVPQATPHRSFAVAEPRPAPARRPFPVLRTATASMALLLVLFFAADATNLFQTTPACSPEAGASSELGTGQEEGGGSYSQDSDTRDVTPSEEPVQNVASAGASGESGQSTPDASDELHSDSVVVDNEQEEKEQAELAAGTPGSEEAGWIRPLEYGLLGMLVVLAGLTLAAWRRARRAAAVSVFAERRGR